MKKTHKYMISGAVLLAAALLLYSYFHVPGGSIDGVSKISPSSSVVIRKGYHLSTEYTEYVLNEEQIVMLKSLIEETSFTRVLSNVVIFEDKDLYDIIVDDSDTQFWLHISSIGGEYISVWNQFDGKHLKINNPNWKQSIEDILALTDKE